MMKVNRNEQTPAICRDREFLVSLKPEAILWQPLFEGAEIAVLSKDPNDGRSPHVVRVKHRDGLKVPPHWHSFDENITVVSGRWGGSGVPGRVLRCCAEESSSFRFVQGRNHCPGAFRRPH